MLIGCAGRTIEPAPRGEGPPQLLPRYDNPQYVAREAAHPPPPFLEESLAEEAEPHRAALSAAQAVDAFVQRGLPGRYGGGASTGDAAPVDGDASSTDADAHAGGLNAEMTPTDLAVMKAYAAARQAMLSGEFADAEGLLEQVLEADPGSAPAWRLRADLARLQGRAGAFLAACERLLRADPKSVYALTHLGRRLASLGEDEDACRLLALARRSAEEDADRIPSPLIDADLGRSLQRLGYHQAAREVYEEMLSSLGAALQQFPYYRNELRYIYEQQSDYLRRAGDAAMRTGDTVAAVQAYDNAARFPELPGGQLLARRIWANLAASRPASAANLLLADLAARPDHAPTPTDARLARYLERQTRLARQMRGALDYLVGQHPQSARLVLARAAWTAPQRSDLAAVRALIEPQPALPSWAAAALAVAPAGSDRIAFAATLLPAHPADSKLMWRALVETSGGAAGLADDLLDAAREGEDAGLCVLAAHALTARGEWPAARRLLEGCSEKSDVLALGRAAVLAEQNRFPEALMLLERLAARPTQHAGATRLRLQVLERMQHVRQALAESDRLAETQSGLTARDHLLRAHLYAALREPLEQAAALRRALELDPDLDEASAELIRLLDRTGPLVDSEAYTQTVQSLHGRNPNSLELRLLRIEEQIRRQEFAPAEDSLLDIAKRSPHREDALDTLVDIWATLRAFERGLETLDELRQDHPHQPNLARAVARLHLHRGDTESALSALDDFLAGHPHVPALHDLSNSALYQAGRTDEAIERIIARAGDVPPSHRTPDMTLALAMSHLGRDEASDAVRVLAHLDERVVLTQAQCAQARHVLLGLLRSRQRQAEEAGRWSVRDVEARIAYKLDRAALWQRAEIHELALALAWYRLVTALDNDEAETALDLLARYREQQRLDDILAAVNEELASGSFDETLYFISNWATLSDASRETILLRLLEINPDHAMALNNLGYTWLEQGTRLEDAVAYLERAYALSPNDHNIADSLGWARYKQGVFEDELGPMGEVLRRGAVSLLREALAQSPDAVAPVVLDHLGDSLWRSSRYDEAEAQWRRAVELLPRAEGAPWQADLRQEVTAKLEALERGEAPPIADSPSAAAVPAAARGDVENDRVMRTDERSR
jgi:tetratricopeptide (TPR) repeat protein